MATNIIYKGEKVGTQVDFQTGSLTDISTFTGDVRGAAIQDQIVDGVTDIGASQDAIHAMSGYLAANAHPTVTPASDVSIDNSSGTVLQDATFTFDDDGHVTEASFVSANLDDRYFTESEVTGISGALQSQITSNDGDITNLSTDIDTVSGLVTGNDAELITLRTATGSLNTRLTSAETDIDSFETATGSLNTRLTSAENDIDVLETSTGNLNTRLTSAETDIDALQAASGNYLSLTLDNVCDNDSTTDQDIQVNNIRVDGGSITGPATITIDPDAVGASGKVIIAGDLQVDGTTTTINSTSVQIDDLSLVLGTGAPNAAAADGGGIIIDGTGVANIAEFTFDGTNNRWKTNSIAIEADILGNASAASGWVADSTITLGGDLTGAVTFNADSSNTLTATIGAGVVENDMLENASVAITGGAGLAGGGDAVLGGSAVSLSISAGHGLTAGADTLDIDLDGTTLTTSSSGIKVNSIGSDQIAADSITEYHLANTIAGDNITITNGVLSVADGDIRAAVFPSDSTLTPDRALVSDSNGKVSVSSTISTTELSHLNSVSSNIQTQLNAKADDSTEMSAGNGLTGGGTLTADRNFSTTADQGHLDEIELGSDNTSVSNIVTKGGILILRGADNNGITTSGSDGNAVALNDKTTVAFEGIVQSARTDQDSDNGSYVAMWKIQGVIRRDADSTNMLQSFVTKTFAGANASAYGLSVSVSGNGLKINSDQNTANLITSATINYNWIEDTTA